MDKVEKIKEELKRRIEEYSEKASQMRKVNNNLSSQLSALVVEYQSILSFIDSLQEEPELSNAERIGKNWKELKTMLDDSLSKETEDSWNEFLDEPVSEDLEEAAFDYAEACKYDGGEKLLCVEHFKAGAKWKKKQMMRDAITAKCFGAQSGDALFSIRLPAKDYLVGSEIKVIIIKEE